MATAAKKKQASKVKATAAITLEGKTATQDMSVGNVSKTEEKNIISFYNEASKHALVDTGLIPLDGTGMLAYRHALNSTQIVFQHKPGLYNIVWGQSERDPNAITYNIAQPWRVWIGDLLDGQLLGIRHFYSPVPVQTPDQQLYHVNLPNLNCKGYSGTSVGWICLYQNHDWGGLSVGELTHKLMELAGGYEAYNDANMSGTDGPRFYKENNKPSFIWDPLIWQQKSWEQGFDWTLDPELWLPILVKGIDDQSQHDANGVPLTLDMAMKGNYQAYYTDKERPKPFNTFARNDISAPTAEVIMQYYNTALRNAKKDFTGGAKVATNPSQVLAKPGTQIVSNCSGQGCTEVFYQDSKYHITVDGHMCRDCSLVYEPCAQCGQSYHYDDLQYGPNDGKYYCTGCKIIHWCPNCGEGYEGGDNIVEGIACVACTLTEQCQSCNKQVIADHLVKVEAKDENSQDTSYQLCHDCASSTTVCQCGFMRESHMTIWLSNEYPKVCTQTCAQYNTDGTIIYQDPSYTPVGITIG